jgi:predicted nuclease of restriction endonuclease-like RecB superfamily
VRFSLQDIKKTVYRRGGELFVSLHFLRPDELQQEIAQLVAYHESMLAQPHRLFSLDEIRAIIGDYRLANCLAATLSHWYHWQPRAWTEAVQERDPSGMAYQRLLAADITSPTALRLALYSYVNERYHGFLSTEVRDEALTSFAASYSLLRVDLEYLLALDSDDEALLMREGAVPPTHQEIISLYNHWAFEAALLQASSVRFVIDCAAFGRAGTSIVAAGSISTGMGAVIKQLCYLARKFGVYYDLAYEDGVQLMGESPRLLLSLYGPQEVTGTAQQYGLRLARLCRLLLGYEHATPSAVYQQRRGTKLIQATSGKVIVNAEATVHFLQRTYTLSIDEHLLRFLQAAREDEGTADTTMPVSDTSSIALFDSSIEQTFAEAFVALARNHTTTSLSSVYGWQLEREPEPLLLEQSIFIPDFALIRPPHRIYVEILGFWTPAYRERKIQKLQQLQGRQDIVLAVPRAAQAAFAILARHFPIIYYDQQLSVTDVLHTLESRYDDFPSRLARVDVEGVRTHIRQCGLLSEHDSYALLQCYSHSELQRAAERIVDEQIVFLAGVGFYHSLWMQQLHRRIMTWINNKIQQKVSLPLGEILQEMRRDTTELTASEDMALELLLSTWSELQVQRDSIFEATVVIVDSITTDESQEKVDDDIDKIKTTLEASVRQARRQVRERRTPLRKHISSETAHQDELW